jgi:predicted O-methyltransferase YrrM
LERDTWASSLKEPTSFYLETLRHFYQKLPAELREHRAYFYNVPQNRRGFGEPAFHVLWHLLMREFKPSNFLEIGVFRGQIVSLIALIAKGRGIACEVYGISPFSPAGDAVSKYRQDIDYYQDTLQNFDHFQLPHPKLLRAYSTDPEAGKLVQSRPWNMIYIDGNHDYEVARKDWEACSKSVSPGGIIVLDDSALTTSYQPPPCLASRGHPGPSRLAKEIDRTKFREILQVGHNRVFMRSGS